MSPHLSRRRFLAISASAIAAPAFAEAPSARWRGYALGGAASARIEGLEGARAAPVFAGIEAELARLEAIFSLFRAESAISELNRSGVLRRPPPELLEVLALCDRLHSASDGAFDPTVQPLWTLHARSAADARPIDRQRLVESLALTGWNKLRFDTSEIRFPVPGMSITLNGVAQGYITDRISGLLEGMGLVQILVDMGEIRAMGSRSDGNAWTAGIAAPDGNLVHRVRLKDRALATSAPSGTVLDPAGRVGHIFDPRTGVAVAGRTLVSVSAPQAAVADGLSTACCVVNDGAIPKVISRFPGARSEILL